MNEPNHPEIDLKVLRDDLSDCQSCLTKAMLHSYAMSEKTILDDLLRIKTELGKIEDKITQLWVGIHLDDFGQIKNS